MHTRDDDMQVCNTHTQERTAIVNGRRDAEPIKLAIIERATRATCLRIQDRSFSAHIIPNSKESIMELVRRPRAR